MKEGISQEEMNIVSTRIDADRYVASMTIELGDIVIKAIEISQKGGKIKLDFPYETSTYPLTQRTPVQNLILEYVENEKWLKTFLEENDLDRV